MSKDADMLYSSYRERLIEHLFVGDILRELWLSGLRQVEVLRAETDAGGYDIVIGCNSVIRHIQLKATRRAGKRATVGVNKALSKKPSGCIVWIFFDPETLNLGPFLWYGGPPGRPLPSLRRFKAGKHTKGDSTGYKKPRLNIKLVPRGAFKRADKISRLNILLFGDIRRTGKGR